MFARFICCGNSTPKTKVKSTCMQLAFAIEGYLQDYGQYPFPIDQTKSQNDLIVNSKILNLLNGSNPRNKVYYSTSSNSTIYHPENKNYYFIFNGKKKGKIELMGKFFEENLVIYSTYKGEYITSSRN
jgi:hypothetical protein